MLLVRLKQFLGSKQINKTDNYNNKENENAINNEEKKEDNKVIKQNFENGLEVEIISEEKVKLLKTFQNDFFKTL